jgi:dienelactone hydrolase
MCSRCCVDPGAKQSHTAQGNEVTIAGFKTYKTGQGKAAIVIFTDVFGFSFINTRKIADTFGHDVGTTVLIPDFLNGDPMDPNDPNLWDKVPAWLQKHPVTEACVSAATYISTINGQYDSIQLIGFCYGAKLVIHCITHPELHSAIKAVVVAHPSFLVKEEAENIKRPILFICAQNDDLFTPELREHYERTLAKTGRGTFIDYPGTTHGFTIRPDGSEQVNQQRNKAVQDASNYFKKHL